MSTSGAVGFRSTRSKAEHYEITLLDRIARGDQKALAEFYNHYIDDVYRFVYHQVGGHRQDAEDVTQETFIAALDSLESFRGESRLYVWLCGIAWRKASDFRRKRDRTQSRQSIADEESLEPTGARSEFRVEDVAERHSLRDQVWQTLLALPEHYRQVLILKYIEEFQVAEIALIMGKSEKAVESLLVRARNAFRAELDREAKSGG
ncbi:MAG: RNA polymerase sigma factor [Chloroflexi bacterium]|nr:MAG: RNA polymerase sigma factor [Chloroflexota bacterium]